MNAGSDRLAIGDLSHHDKAHSQMRKKDFHGWKNILTEACQSQIGMDLHGHRCRLLSRHLFHLGGSCRCHSEGNMNAVGPLWVFAGINGSPFLSCFPPT